MLSLKVPFKFCYYRRAILAGLNKSIEISFMVVGHRWAFKICSGLGIWAPQQRFHRTVVSGGQRVGISQLLSTGGRHCTSTPVQLV